MRLTEKEKYVMNAIIEADINIEERTIKANIHRLPTIAKEYKEWFQTNFVETHKSRIDMMRSIQKKLQK